MARTIPTSKPARDSLRIADDLTLPRDAHTQTIVVYGGKGMGKTNFAAVLCEELQRTGLRFCYLDPVGVAWGMRHGRTRREPGLKVLALGGLRGDIPIEPTAGHVVADLVVDETVDVLIDISRRANGTSWSKAEKIKFVTDYMTRLYARQGEKRRPIMQIVDEAGRFVPQQMRSGDEQIAACVGAIEEVVELGRNVGIGVTLITQRSARMAKAVSELAECMISFRIIGPNSVKAVLDWFGEHTDAKTAKALIGQLRTLDRGEALVVAPGWLHYEGAAHIRARHTFDSSATPRGRAVTRAPGRARTPDLAQYRERMKATIEQSEANDPRKLHALIADLRRQLTAKRDATPRTAKPVETVHERVRTVKVPVLTERQGKALYRMADDMHTVQRTLERGTLTIAMLLLRMEKAQGKIDAQAPATVPLPPRPKPVPLPPKAPKPTPKGATPPSENGDGDGFVLVSGMRKILATLKQLGPSNRGRFGLVLGINAKGTTITAYLQRLARAGLIVEQTKGVYAITERGLEQVQDVDELPLDANSLIAHWRERLGTGGMRQIFDLALKNHHVTRDTAGALLAINPKGTTITAYLQRLARLGVITKVDSNTYSIAEQFYEAKAG